MKWLIASDATKTWIHITITSSCRPHVYSIFSHLRSSRKYTNVQARSLYRHRRQGICRVDTYRAKKSQIQQRKSRSRAKYETIIAFLNLIEFVNHSRSVY